MRIFLISFLTLISLQAFSQGNEGDMRTLMDMYYKEMRSNYPEWMSRQGIKDRQNEWNDDSDELQDKLHQRNQGYLEQMRQKFHLSDELNTSGLDDLSSRLFVQMLQGKMDDYKWRHYSYPVEQMHGMHSSIPAFLINVHSISNTEDAKAYIARVKGLRSKVAQLITNLETRKNKGIIAPRFAFDHVIDDCKKLLKGKPFEQKGDDCALLADFKKKLGKSNISQPEQQLLTSQLSNALEAEMKPMYLGLVGYLEQLQKLADGNKGVWALPDGGNFYKYRLKKITTTSLEPNDIFELGQNEVNRIHNEMRAIMKQVDYNKDLQSFFDFMRKDKQFYYSNDAGGKEAYISEAKKIIGAMNLRLDELFITKPKADLIVKPVEAFREKSAGKAFYNRPAPDGSRPGVYYANLYDMSEMPKYQMEALAYHEAIPGHHMQLAIAQELKDIPMFRKYGSFTAYIEGWGLSSEYIPKELGFYQDPYSDFGRLAMELWRSCRLVADVGIHEKKWTREQAIEFYKKNTPNPEGDCIKMVERHFVMPGQATAYKIGMLKIMELKKRAEQMLGSKFDIRGFHEVILKDGAVPLNIMEEHIMKWIESKKRMLK